MVGMAIVPAALQGTHNSLVQYLERGEGGYEYDRDAEVLNFRAFWARYRIWCKAEGLPVYKPKSDGRTVAEEFRLKDAAEELGWPVTVDGFPQTIVGMDLVSQIGKPGRDYGRNTLKAFFVTMMVPDEDSKTNVSVLKKEYAAYCLANRCNIQKWSKVVVTKAIEEFECKKPGAAVEPKNEKGKIVDGSRCYKGFVLARRLR